MRTKKLTYAERGFVRDNKKRFWAGRYHAMAFIAPTFPKGKTKAEREAVEFVLERHPTSYMMHIYTAIHLVHDYIVEKEKHGNGRILCRAGKKPVPRLARSRS